MVGFGGATLGVCGGSPTPAVPAVELEPDEPALAGGQRVLAQERQSLGGVEEDLEGLELPGQGGAVLQPRPRQRVGIEDVVEAPRREELRLGQRRDHDAAAGAACCQLGPFSGVGGVRGEEVRGCWGVTGGFWGVLGRRVRVCWVGRWGDAGGMMEGCWEGYWGILGDTGEDTGMLGRILGCWEYDGGMLGETVGCVVGYWGKYWGGYWGGKRMLSEKVGGYWGDAGEESGMMLGGILGNDDGGRC